MGIQHFVLTLSPKIFDSPFISRWGTLYVSTVFQMKWWWYSIFMLWDGMGCICNTCSLPTFFLIGRCRVKRYARSAIFRRPYYTRVPVLLSPLCFSFGNNTRHFYNATYLSTTKISVLENIIPYELLQLVFFQNCVSTLVYHEYIIFKCIIHSPKTGVGPVYAVLLGKWKYPLYLLFIRLTCSLMPTFHPKNKGCCWFCFEWLGWAFSNIKW